MKITLYFIILSMLLLGCTSRLTAPSGNTNQPEPLQLPTTADSKPTPPQQLPVTLLPGLPAAEEEMKMTPENPPAIPAEMQSLIQNAKLDLAARLAVDPDQVQVVRAEAVVWPNSSLGCPQPGMLYMEVLTPGYLILLSANAQPYEYHAGKNSDAFYCQNPTPPAAGEPADT